MIIVVTSRCSLKRLARLDGEVFLIPLEGKIFFEKSDRLSEFYVAGSMSERRPGFTVTNDIPGLQHRDRGGRLYLRVSPVMLPSLSFSLHVRISG